MPNIPVVWRARQTVNTVTAGNPFDPDIVQLANGDSLVSWMKEGDADSPGAGRWRRPVDRLAKTGRDSP